jgi:uncharacterized spore protein YtfJ
MLAMSIQAASGGIMENPAPFAPIAELLERSLSIRHVYGDPVERGDTTVIPIARVAYGFGAGGGRGPGRGRTHTVDDSASQQGSPIDAHGAGGGGGVRMTPVGALEIGPDGTHFVHFQPWAPWLGGAALGLLLGWAVARRLE